MDLSELFFCLYNDLLSVSSAPVKTVGMAMFKTMAAMALLSASAAANAKSIYLTCDFGADPVSVSLNEAGGTVTYGQKSGTETGAAHFTGDFVMWGSKGLLTKEFKIDRSSLKITRKYQVADNAPLVSEGKCKLAPAKKRAF